MVPYRRYVVLSLWIATTSLAAQVAPRGQVASPMLHDALVQSMAGAATGAMIGLVVVDYLIVHFPLDV